MSKREENDWHFNMVFGMLVLVMIMTGILAKSLGEQLSYVSELENKIEIYEHEKWVLSKDNQFLRDLLLIEHNNDN